MKAKPETEQHLITLAGERLASKGMERMSPIANDVEVK
jgi:hypothetical protein